jgi:hypothetical protein
MRSGCVVRGAGIPSETPELNQEQPSEKVFSSAANRIQSTQLPYQPMDLVVAPVCTAAQRRTQPPYKSATTLSIDFFQYLSLCLLFEEEDLFRFYVSFVRRFAFHFEGAYFRQLRGSFLAVLNRAGAGY